MSKIELLDNVTHKDLQVASWYSAELGDNVASTLTFMAEFVEVQKEYPILFRKDTKTGAYQAVVFFGIQKDENLFLCERDSATQVHPGWRANYVPAAMARGPFSVGFQRPAVASAQQVEPVVHVDMEHPKVGVEGGEPVFLPKGGTAPYLQRTMNALSIIRDGVALNKQMVDAFQKNELLEPVSIDIDLESGERFHIAGFETINAEKLLALSGAALESLNKPGFLQAAYCAMASLSNIKRLIELKNRKANRAR